MEGLLARDPPVTDRRITRLAAWLAIAGLALAVSLTTRLRGQGAGAPSLTLYTRSAQRAIPLTVSNDQEYVGLDELASVFQLAVREESGAITVSYKGKTIVLNPDQTIASVAGRMISLPARPLRQGEIGRAHV